MQEFLSHPVVQMGLAGVLSAAAIDFAEFRKWKRWEDAATYDWRVATFRWFQGGFVGFISGWGLNVWLH